MTLQIPDSMVDAIKIEIAPPDSPYYINVIIDDRLPEDTVAIEYYLESIQFSDIHFYAEAAQAQTGFGSDAADIHYFRSNEEFFPDVRIAAFFGLRDPIAEVNISREACDRLLTRFFDLMIQIAEQRQYSILQSHIGKGS